MFGVKRVGVCGAGPTWRWQGGLGWRRVRHRWARVDSEKGGVTCPVWLWKKFSRDVGIRRAGLVRKGLVGTEDGGACLRLVA